MKDAPLREMPLHFPSDTLTLEGVLHWPEGQGPFPGVVACHPHPLYGGDMENNVVVALSRFLARNGMVALRFNFRGVGGSDGDFSGGVGEGQDAAAALSFLASQKGIDKERLTLAGYSFGAVVILNAAPYLTGVKALVAIAPPLEYVSRDLLAQNPLPKLLICGGKDALVPAGEVKSWVRGLPSTEAELIPEADHFLWSYEEVVASRAWRFLERWLK